MRTSVLFMAAATLCLTLAVGCSQNSQVVRSQGPETVYSGDDCDYCEDDCDGWCHCTPYRVPGDLVYPPPNDQPAIVQYPYYTHKGPDCFFHK